MKPYYWQVPLMILLFSLLDYLFTKEVRLAEITIIYIAGVYYGRKFIRDKDMKKIIE